MPNWIDTLQSTSKPAYAAVVDAIRSGIADGTFAENSRLPTHRELAEHLGVARGTVMHGYREAERLGLIRAHVGRGTFVCPGKSQEVRPGGLAGPDEVGVVDLSANRPLHALDPSMRRALAAIGSDAVADGLTRYTAVAGSARHLRVGQKWLSTWGVESAMSDLVVCAGAQHAIFCALSTVACAGDTVAVEALTYASIKPIAETLGLRLVGVATDEYGIKPEALRAACVLRKMRALYCVPTIQNPTGSVLDESRRREIVAIAREFDLLIIEDDIHRLYHPSPPPTIVSLAPERTVFIAATSKCLAGGLRVAFVRCPERVYDGFRRTVLSTVWNVAPLMVEVTCRWLSDGTADQVIKQKRAECIARHELARRLLPGVKFYGYLGGLSAWIGLPARWSSAAFALESQRHGVLVSHDADFAVGEPPVNPCVRLSLSAPETSEVLMRGLELLAMILRRGPATGDSGK